MIRHVRSGRAASLAWVLPAVLVGCDPAAPPPQPASPTTAAVRMVMEPTRVVQASVIDALMAGRYDGVMSIAELLQYGDFGMGTLDHLDGELTVLDGVAYQARHDGTVVTVPGDRSTPFATVTPFIGTGERGCPMATNLRELEARLDETLPQRNHFVAIRIDGKFAALTVRSVRRQEPPYRPLDEVAGEQEVHHLAEVSGTMVGFRSPAWTGGLNVPGYHWHFLTADRKGGGHVLDCRPMFGRVQYGIPRDWEIKLDRAPAFDRMDLTRDRSRELRRVEGTRGEPPQE